MKLVVLYFIIFTAISWAAEIPRKIAPNNVNDMTVKNEPNIEGRNVPHVSSSTSVPSNVTNGLTNMIPDPPVKLMVNNILSDGVTISWKQPSFNGKFLTYSISYTSEYSNGQWEQLRHITRQKKNMKFKLTNLQFAYAQYAIRIRTKVKNAQDISEMWSNYTYYNFTTKARIPDDMPATYVGGFHPSADGKSIRILWKELPLNQFNGPNPMYKVYAKNGIDTILLTKTTDVVADYILEGTNRLNDIEISVFASNDVGDSKTASVIRVPSKRSQYPRDLYRGGKALNDTHGHNYLSWSEPDENDIIGYTICWRQIIFHLSDDKSEVEFKFNFEHVDKTVHHWEKSILSKHAVVSIAIATNTLTTTSGIIYVVEDYDEYE